MRHYNRRVRSALLYEAELQAQRGMCVHFQCCVLHGYKQPLLSARVLHILLLTLLLTLCGLTSQKTHRGGLGLSGSVHEEAHPCFPYFA